MYAQYNKMEAIKTDQGLIKEDIVMYKATVEHLKAKISDYKEHSTELMKDVKEDIDKVNNKVDLLIKHLLPRNCRED